MKLRGHRIELGEIEACLLRLDGVAEAVAVVQGRGEHQQLVAIVRFGGPRIAEQELVDELARHLPAYMIPRLAVVDRMPLTPNGKVDRKALSAKTLGARESLRQAEPVTTETEAMIARWFSEILQCDVADRNANFFDLGGQSLLATRLAHRILTFFGVELPLHAFFREPTVRAVASRVEQMVAERRGDLMKRIDSMSESEIDEELKRLGLA